MRNNEAAADAAHRKTAFQSNAFQSNAFQISSPVELKDFGFIGDGRPGDAEAKAHFLNFATQSGEPFMLQEAEFNALSEEERSRLDPHAERRRISTTMPNDNEIAAATRTEGAEAFQASAFQENAFQTGPWTG